MATLKGQNLYDLCLLTFTGQVWLFCVLKKALGFYAIRRWLPHLHLQPWLLQTRAQLPLYTSNGISQGLLKLSCPTVLLIIFTNPVLPETSTFSSQSLGIIFNSSFLKLHNNQLTNPVSTFETHPECDHCSPYPPKLQQSEPPLCCS